MFEKKAEKFLMKLVIGIGIPFGAMIMHIKTSFLISFILAIVKE